MVNLVVIFWISRKLMMRDVWAVWDTHDSLTLSSRKLTSTIVVAYDYEVHMYIQLQCVITRNRVSLANQFVRTSAGFVSG